MRRTGMADISKIHTENLTRKGLGRPKGSLNKTTSTAKDMLAKAADKLGGVDRMVAWAREAPENERVFWGSMFPRLLPVQVGNDDDKPFKTEEVGQASAKLASLIATIAERSTTAG